MLSRKDTEFSSLQWMSRICASSRRYTPANEQSAYPPSPAPHGTRAPIEERDDGFVHLGGRAGVQERIDVVGAPARVGVVTHVEAGVQPLVDDCGARVALAMHVQLLFVDENRDRHPLGLERPDQAGGHSLKIAQVGWLTDHRTVVNRDGDAPHRRLSRQGGWDEDERQYGCTRTYSHRQLHVSRRKRITFPCAMRSTSASR
jgi:hypothetical protein